MSISSTMSSLQRIHLKHICKAEEPESDKILTLPKLCITSVMQI